MYYIEKWCIWSQFFCFVLKNEEWGFLKTLSKKNLHSYVIYWKMRFFKSILLFYIEKWGFLKTLFPKMLHSYVLYWKMRFLKSILLFCIEKWGFKKTLSWKNSILMYYIEKWCFWGQFFCFVLKNEEWEFLKILSEKMLHSYVLYWKMRFLKSILLFYIEKW